MKIINKSLRHDIYKLFLKGTVISETAKVVNTNERHVRRCYNQFKVAQFGEKRKPKKPEEYNEQRNLFHVLGSASSFSNPFVLLSNDHEVYEAFRAMVNNRNTDIKM